MFHKGHKLKKQKPPPKRVRYTSDKDIHFRLSHHNNQQPTLSLIESGIALSSLHKPTHTQTTMSDQLARLPLLLPPTEKMLRLLLQPFVLLALGVVPMHVAAATAARVEVLVLGRPHGGLGHNVRVAGGLGAALAGLDVRRIHVAGAAALNSGTGCQNGRFSKKRGRRVRVTYD